MATTNEYAPTHREVGTGRTLCGYTGFHLKYEREHGEVTCRRCLAAMRQVYECGRDNCPGTAGTSHRTDACPSLKGAL